MNRYAIPDRKSNAAKKVKKPCRSTKELAAEFDMKEVAVSRVLSNRGMLPALELSRTSGRDSVVYWHYAEAKAILKAFKEDKGTRNE